MRFSSLHSRFARWGAIACAAALALVATAVLLAPGAAQARDECGALSSGVATCADMAYASGIRYDVADGWGNGIAGDIALTVTGGSSTTITSGTTMNAWGSGIVLRTAHHATDTRAIALTVGTGSNAVVIAQSSATITGGFDDTGVVLHQRGDGASPTTVTLGSGVAIGTMTAPMQRGGVHMLVEMTGNTADHSITSAADIYSSAYGIVLDARGSGSTAITNSGTIVNLATTGGVTGQGDGIRILDWSGTGGNERPATATTTVTNSGSITVNQAGGSPIRVDAEGLGLYKVVNSGTVSAAATAAHGLFVEARRHWGAAGTEAVEIENSGSVTTASTGGIGIYVETVANDALQGRGDGNVAVTNSGTVSSSSVAVLVNSNMGDTTIKHTGGSITSTAVSGIQVQQGGTGAVTIESGADITAQTYGIRVLNNPSPAATTVTVAVAAGVTTRTNKPAVAIAAGTTTTTYATLGDVSVTHSGGDIAAETESGIHAQNSAGNADAVTVRVTGGSVKTEGQSKAAVAVLQFGTGDAVAGVSSGATLTSKHNAGIYADLSHADNVAGQVRSPRREPSPPARASTPTSGAPAPWTRPAPPPPSPRSTSPGAAASPTPPASPWPRTTTTASWRTASRTPSSSPRRWRPRRPSATARRPASRPRSCPGARSWWPWPGATIRARSPTRRR